MTRLILTSAAIAAFAIPAFLTGSPLKAQAPPADLTFDVASVKPNKSGDGRVLLGIQPGGRFTATNVPARMLLRQAYNVQDFQIVGAPDWMGSDRFDVIAKAPGGDYNGEQMRPMLRALLAERFKLTAHNETREMPVYVLMKARSDGKLGAKLTPAAVDCAAARGRRGGGPPPAPPQPGQRIECGFMIGLGRMSAGGMPILELARTLSQQVGRVVLDKTELTGNYDFELTYAPQQLAGPAPLLNGAPPPVDPDAPSLFTALQEQLGLKLDTQRGPVEVLVIDRVEQPTAD